MENNNNFSRSIDQQEEDEEQIELPPGFRFHPTDEELITHYLIPKFKNSYFSAKAIGEADLNKSEPWDLPGMAKMGEKEWYFFCVRDRKYPTGLRTNRATESGYWKATGKDKEIYRGKRLIGMKKTLVFYKGRAPKGEKSNWVMHEYRSEAKFPVSHPLLFPNSTTNEWVICRIFHKNSSSGEKKIHNISDVDRLNNIFEFENNLISSSSLPPLMDYSYASSPYYNSEPRVSHVTCFSDDHPPMAEAESKPPPPPPPPSLQLQPTTATTADHNLHHRHTHNTTNIQNYSCNNLSSSSPPSTCSSIAMNMNMNQNHHEVNPASVWMPPENSSIVRMLLENETPYPTTNLKQEEEDDYFSLDREDPSTTSDGPVDLASLWWGY